MSIEPDGLWQTKFALALELFKTDMDALKADAVAKGWLTDAPYDERIVTATESPDDFGVSDADVDAILSQMGDQ